MAVRIADSLKQQNDSKNFPVAYAEDIWVNTNTSTNPNYKSVQSVLQSLDLSNTASQVKEIPTEPDYGQVVQYIGETTDDYIHGHFYEYIETNKTYSWEEISFIGTEETETIDFSKWENL